jgi:hypothetical protein
MSEENQGNKDDTQGGLPEFVTLFETAPSGHQTRLDLLPAL